MPWTYMLRCADGSYYVGSTIDLDGRLWQHNSDDQGAVYTRSRRPVELAWAADFERIDEAFAFEKRVQGWSRKKREALIQGDYDALPFSRSGSPSRSDWPKQRERPGSHALVDRSRHLRT